MRTANMETPPAALGSPMLLATVTLAPPSAPGTRSRLSPQEREALTDVGAHDLRRKLSGMECAFLASAVLKILAIVLAFIRTGWPGKWPRQPAKPTPSPEVELSAECNVVAEK